MRTPTSTNTFNAALQMNGTSSILLKTAGTATITNATFNSGTISQAIAPNSTGTFAGNFAIPGSMAINLGAKTADNRTMNLAASLSGAGLVTVDGSSDGSVGGTLNLNGDSSAFSGGWLITDKTKLNVLTANSLGTGNITIDSGTTFNADADLDIPAQLTLNGVMTLDQNHTFDAVIIAGTILANGTYSFDDLNFQWDANFANGGSGSITVDNSIPPTTYELNKSQPFGNSWTTGADWTNTSDLTTGVAPIAGDLAVVNSNFGLRTPDSGSPTLRALFSMSAGTLVMKTTGTSTIVNATFTGGTIGQGIANNSTGTLAGNYVINGPLGINLGSATGNIRSINLAATLSGSGTLTVDGSTNSTAGGNLRLNADNSAFSGSWSIVDYANIVVNAANGLGTGDVALSATTTLNPNVDIGNMGNLTLDGIITLDQNLTAATAIVNGVTMWNGSYTHTDLSNLGLAAHFTNDGGTLTVLGPFGTIVRIR